VKRSTEIFILLSKVFVDTSGWAYLFVESEPQHHLAVQCFKYAQQQRQYMVTTNYVLLELVALLHSPLRLPRSQIVQIVDAIKNSPDIQIVHLNLELDGAAWDLCKNRIDKSWSLVDCSSFVLMKQLKILEALTTDRHFEQAGFGRLLQ
jgi:uncharacterized protein